MIKIKIFVQFYEKREGYIAGTVLVNNGSGCGSERLKNIRIRMRMRALTWPCPGGRWQWVRRSGGCCCWRRWPHQGSWGWRSLPPLWKGWPCCLNTNKSVNMTSISLQPVLRIRIGFNADPETDPDPAFFVNADPDTDTDSDPDPRFWWPKIGKNLNLK